MKRQKTGNSILLFHVYSLITPVQILTHCCRANQRGKELFIPVFALTHTLTHTAKRADGNNGINRPRPHPFWSEKRPKALQRNGLKLPKLLVRMRSAVRIRPAAPLKPLNPKGFRGFQFFGNLLENRTFQQFFQQIHFRSFSFAVLR